MFVCLGFAVALVFVTGISAGAEPGGGIRAKEADVAAAQDRLMEIRVEASAAEAAYNDALYEMNQLNGQIEKASEDLDAARERASTAKENLEERAAQVYKSGNVAFMDVLVGVENFSEFAARLNLWVRLLGQQRADFVELREARNELAARKDRLKAEREQRVEAVERAITQKERAEKAEAQAEAYLDSLNDDLRAAIEAAQDRQAERARAAMAAMVETASEPEPKSKAELAAARAAERRAAREEAERQAERAAERAAIEEAAAEQAAAERAAARRAAERRAERQAELRAEARQEARAAEASASASASAAAA
jgi:peptidoglycan hydrolase CwlO-like protein